MPYLENDPPERIRDLPAHGQKVWLGAYISAYEDNCDENTCESIAWREVEKAFEEVLG